MAKKKEVVEETVEQVVEGSNALLDGLHKVLLAGIGAVSLAQSEVEAFVNKLIEKGEIAEEDGKKLIKDIDSRRKDQTKKAEKELDSRLDGILDRLNVPSKSDIDTLNKKIAQLNEKIDALNTAE